MKQSSLVLLLLLSLFIVANYSFCDAALPSCTPGSEETECASSQYCDEKLSVCKITPSGSYATNGIKRECPKGTFANVSGLAKCYSAAALHGRSDQVGATRFSFCDAGWDSTQNGIRCTKCVIPKYGKTRVIPSSSASDYGAYGCSEETTCSISDGCVFPSPGHFVFSNGSTTAIKCNSGYYSTFGNWSECKPCEPGSFCDRQGCSQCEPCETFYVTNQSASSGCKTKCLQGLEPNSEKTRCLTCRPGSYKPLTEGPDLGFAVYCRNCTGNTVQPLSGQASCNITCQQGFEATTSRTKCVACERGSYRGNSDDACTRAILGTYVSSVASPTYQVCNGPQVAVNESGEPVDSAAVDCKDVPDGFFCNAERNCASSKLRGCKPGFTSTEASRASGIAAIDACVECPVDTYKKTRSVRFDNGTLDRESGLCKPCTDAHTSTRGLTGQTACHTVTKTLTKSITTSQTASETQSDTSSESQSRTLSLDVTLSNDSATLSETAPSPGSLTDTRETFSSSPSMNSSTREQSESDSPGTRSRSPSRSRPSGLSESLSESVTESASRNVTPTRSLPGSRTAFGSNTESQTNPIPTPPPPLGLSAEAQEAIQSSAGVAAGVAAFAAAPAALSATRGLAVLRLVGCPPPPEDAEDRKPAFPKSLFPGFSSGNSKEKFNRGSIIAFIIVVVVVVLVTLALNAEVIGARPDSFDTYDEEADKNAERLKEEKKKKEREQEQEEEQNHQDIEIEGEQQEESEEGENEEEVEKEQSEIKIEGEMEGETEQEDAFSPRENIQQEMEGEQEQNEEQEEQEEQEEAEEYFEERNEEHDDEHHHQNEDNFEAPLLPSPTAAASGDGVVESGNKKNQKRKLPNLNLANNNKNNNNSNSSKNDSKSSSSSSSPGSKSESAKKEVAKVSKRPQIMLMIVSACLGLTLAPQAGVLFSSLQPLDIVLALVPLVIVFAYHIYLAVKVRNSIHDEKGIYFTESWILETKRKEGFVGVSREKDHTSPKAILESEFGRYAFLGRSYWTRPRGFRCGRDAQVLLASLGSVIQKMRGPRVVIDFLNTKNPLELLLKNEEARKWVQQTDDWDQQELPTQILQDKDWASYIAPHFLLISWFESGIVGFLQGIGEMDSAKCPGIAITICVVNVISFLLSLWIRPYVVPLRNHVTIALDATVAIVSLLAVCLLMKNDPANPPADAIVGLAAFIQVFVGFAAFAGSAVMIFSSGVRFALLFFFKARICSNELAWAHSVLRRTELESAVELMEEHGGFVGENGEALSEKERLKMIDRAYVSNSAKLEDFKKKKKQKEEEQKKEAAKKGTTTLASIANFLGGGSPPRSSSSRMQNQKAGVTTRGYIPPEPTLEDAEDQDFLDSMLMMGAKKGKEKGKDNINNNDSKKKKEKEKKSKDSHHHHHRSSSSSSSKHRHRTPSSGTRIIIEGEDEEVKRNEKESKRKKKHEGDERSEKKEKRLKR